MSWASIFQTWTSLKPLSLFVKLLQLLNIELIFYACSYFSIIYFSFRLQVSATNPIKLFQAKHTYDPLLFSPNRDHDLELPLTKGDYLYVYGSLDEVSSVGNATSNYMFKGYNKNTKTSCEVQDTLFYCFYC